MPYNLPTNNKIDNKDLDLNLKNYVDARAKFNDPDAKKLAKVFSVVSTQLNNLQSQSNTQASLS